MQVRNKQREEQVYYEYVEFILVEKTSVSGWLYTSVILGKRSEARDYS